MISIIVLAAGESKRFGSPKQLAKIGAETLINHLIKNLKATCADEIIVVLGAYKDEIQKILTPGIKTVINDNFLRGQTSSLKTGLKNISPQAEYFLILPADSAFIRSVTIDFIIDKFKEQKSLVGIPVYQNKRGHPPIYNIKLKENILKLKDSDPLYVINQEFKSQTLEIPVDDPAILFNINTPEDLEQIKNYL